MELITLLRTLEILLLRTPSVSTTAMVITPSTTAYSAIVWPDSSLRSANRRLRYSIKEFTSSTDLAEPPGAGFLVCFLFRQPVRSLEAFRPISPLGGTGPSPVSSLRIGGGAQCRN